MKIINKPVYKCEYCDKEFLSNRGGADTRKTLLQKKADKEKI